MVKEFHKTELNNTCIPKARPRVENKTNPKELSLRLIRIDTNANTYIPAPKIRQYTDLPYAEVDNE